MGQPVTQLNKREVYPHDFGMKINQTSNTDRDLLIHLNPAILEVDKYNPDYLINPNSFNDFQRACEEYRDLPEDTANGESVKAIELMEDSKLRKFKDFIAFFILNSKNEDLKVINKQKFLEGKPITQNLRDLSTQIDSLLIGEFIAELRENYSSTYAIDQLLFKFLLEARQQNSSTKTAEYKQSLNEVLQIIYGERYVHYIKFMGLRFSRFVDQTDLSFRTDVKDLKAKIKTYPFNVVDNEYIEVLEVERKSRDL